MLQQFLRTASDGWELALASARNLFAEADLHADEVGGDFAGEAHRLGVAVSEVHELLREHFGTAAVRRRRARAEAMRQRLTARVGVVPALAEHRAALERCSPRIGDAAGRRPADPRRPAPRADAAHRRWAGSSSTSRASRPSRWPSAGCRTPRGATSPACCAPSTTPPSRSSRTCTPPTSRAPQITYRANEWVERNRSAFLEGYVERRIEGGADRSAPTSRRSSTPTRPTRPSTRSSTRHATAPPGWTSRCSAIDRIGADTMSPTPTIGEIDLHLINEGRHEQLWQALGAHVRRGGTSLPGLGPAAPWRSRSAATSTAGTAAAAR